MSEKELTVEELAEKYNFSPQTILRMLKDRGFKGVKLQTKVTPEMEETVKSLLEEQKRKEKERMERKKRIWGREEKPEERGKRRFYRRPRRRVSREKVEERVKRTLKGGPPKKSPQKTKRIVPSVEPVEEEEKKELIIPAPVTVAELAKMMEVSASEVITEALKQGIVVSMNQTLDLETIELLADSFGYTVKREPEEVVEEKAGKEEELTERKPPVVTVMGHVDHGKTTLLDRIRKTNVAAREFGEITQHIGASRVIYEGNQITFIDTPGHEAFTALRARGAQVTDIVVLVVAANEGVKPQTIEALNHAKAAGVPIIVAINKMDLPDADPERVKRELSKHGLVPEDWGGDTIYVEVSAKTGMGIEELLEAILVKAEELELKTTTKGPAKGVVLESKIEKGRGPVATVLIERGILKRGDSFVAGLAWGRVRAIYDEFNRKLNELKPGDPGVVQGFDALPRAGDIFEVVESETKAREIAEERERILKEQLVKGDKLSIAQKLKEMLSKGEIKELPVIIKGDCQGSVEAIADTITRLEVEGVKVKILHSEVGFVKESDVLLASASNGIILAFNTGVDPKAREAAKREKVTIKTYRLIYELIDDVEKFLKGFIEPEIKEEVIGKVEVRQVFKVPKVGKVAGCYVLEGVVRRGAMARIMRDGEALHEGKIISLKRFKEDVKEVAQGYECGLKVQDFEDYKEGDVIEVYQIVKETKT